jgi:hypothetical protein
MADVRSNVVVGWSDRTIQAARFALPLIGIVGVAVAIRAYADNAGQFIRPYLRTYYAKELDLLAGLPWWKLLLPLEPLYGRWGTTGFLLVHGLETFLGEPNTFYLLTAVMVTVGYVLTYLTFGSLSLAFLLGFALATTTFNYHVYSVSGGVMMLPLVSFLLMFAYSQIEWLRSSALTSLWPSTTVASCLLFALSYEGWLDVVPLILIVYPVLAWVFKRNGDLVRSRRCILILCLVTTTAAIYIGVKMIFGLGGLHPRGGEADLIFTYGRDHVILMLEDIISSFFTFFFTTITTFVPPQLFSFSISSWIYGPEKIIALQEGYHPQAIHLTHYNHLFLWRYYAGFLLAVFLFLYVRVIRKLVVVRDMHNLILFVLLTCTLIGSPTHLVIKWRPMHAAPFLGYQCYLSIIGWTYLLCYVVEHQSRLWRASRGFALRLLLVLNFLYCAYARPALLSHMSKESFLGTYPDPRDRLHLLRN